MFESEDQLRQRIAQNLMFFREAAGDTQFELAEKLNYSDKSVSKWERGEGIPSAFVLTQIADLYGITVNDLLAESPQKPRRFLRYNHFLITMMSFGLVWLVATFVYIVLRLAAPAFPAWYTFLFAVPVNAVVAIVFTAIWWPRFWVFISSSALIWSSVVCLVLSIPRENITLFYIFAAVLQVLVCMWFLLRRSKPKTAPPPPPADEGE